MKRRIVLIRCLRESFVEARANTLTRHTQSHDPTILMNLRDSKIERLNQVIEQPQDQKICLTDNHQIVNE